jgi:hypothetical protein
MWEVLESQMDLWVVRNWRRLSRVFVRDDIDDVAFGVVG